MLNLLWGGLETNQVGTAEFVDFCRQTGSRPFFCVNFESDGRRHVQDQGQYSLGRRAGGGRLGAVLQRGRTVRSERPMAGPSRTMFVSGRSATRLRMIVTVSTATAARKTVAFAQAMRGPTRTSRWIGWGDSGWAARMLEVAGEHLQYIAFHDMFNPDGNAADSPLRGIEYRKDPDRTWGHLMDAVRPHEAKIRWIREQTAGYSTPLAMTECHFALPGRIAAGTVDVGRRRCQRPTLNVRATRRHLKSPHWPTSAARAQQSTPS